MNLNLPRKKTVLGLLVVSLVALPALGNSPSSLDAGLPDLVMTRIESLRQDLKLNPAQQSAFDRALAKTETIVPQIRSNRQALRAATQAEMAKDLPDLASLAAQKDRIELNNLALRQTARAEWLALYATFTPEQAAIVKQRMHRVMTKLDALRKLLPGQDSDS